MPWILLSLENILLIGKYEFLNIVQAKEPSIKAIYIQAEDTHIA